MKGSDWNMHTFKIIIIAGRSAEPQEVLVVFKQQTSVRSLLLFADI